MWRTGTERLPQKLPGQAFLPAERRTRMSAPATQIPPQRHGAALVIVTLLISVLSVFALAAVSYLVNSLHGNQDRTADTRAAYVAELGRADAYAYVVAHPEGAWPYSRGLTTVQDDQGAPCGEYSYTITDLTLPGQNQKRRVCVHAYWPDQANAMAEHEMTFYMELHEGFVAVWEGVDADAKGVFAQRYDSDGVGQGGEFQVNTATTGDQKEPAMAIAVDGSFVVVWEGVDADAKGVFARRYDSGGVAQGGEFQVNSTTTGDQKLPDVAMDVDGDFVVVWEGVDADLKGVFAQRYDSDGVAQGGESQVNTTTTGEQKEPAVAIAADGSFVVVWEGVDADKAGVSAQRYDSDGAAQGGESQVNTTTTGDQKKPAVAVNAGWGTRSCTLSRVTDD